MGSSDVDFVLYAQVARHPQDLLTEKPWEISAETIRMFVPAQGGALQLQALALVKTQEDDHQQDRDSQFRHIHDLTQEFRDDSEAIQVNGSNFLRLASTRMASRVVV